MRPGFRRLRSIVLLPVAILLVNAISAHGDYLFLDNFNGPPLNSTYRAELPKAPDRYQARFEGGINYVGAPTYTFETVDGAETIHLRSILDDTQRAGWSTTATFSTIAPVVLEARFNTMVQSATTGIDQLLEIWLLDAANQDRYDVVALSAPNYGQARIFSALGSLTLAGVDTGFPFLENTWYRMVLSGGPTTMVRASIYADDGTTELIGVDLGHTLADLGGNIRIGLSQSMGVPGGLYPTNSAVDYISLTTPGAVPEPTSFVLLGIGVTTIGLLRILRRTRGGKPNAGSP